MTDSSPPQAPKLDFERAELAEPSQTEVRCGFCGQTVTTEYWQFAGKVVCKSCREGVRRGTEEAKRSSTFVRACLLAGVVALGCGIAYAVFVGVTNIQFGLVTIGIGWAVGRAVQKVTRGFGTTKYQIMAVGLTYFATSMGYLPAFFAAVSGAQQVAAPAPADPAASPAPQDPAGRPAPEQAVIAAPPEAAPTDPSPEEQPSLLYALGLLAFYMLAAPFFDVMNGVGGIIGLLIVFFGLQTAWRVSRGVQAAVTGPHQLAAAPSP